MSRDPLTGTIIAGYALEQRVGEGGTATVYRASHAQHGTVALKVLRDKLRQDRTAVARFLREASFGTRVQHPNVVKTLELGQSPDGLHYLAIEWAAGELLEGYAKRAAPLPPEEVATIITQIAAAVHAAHANGIVHRDVKPANLLLDRDGNVQRLAKQVGVTYRYDKRQEQYAHPAAVMVLTPQGRMARYLYGIRYRASDLRFAMAEASEGRTTMALEKVLLFCFHYDPRAGRYVWFALNLMRLGGILTVALIAAYLWRMFRAERARSLSAAHERFA